MIRSRVCLRLVQNHVSLDQWPFIWKIGKHREDFIAKSTRDGGGGRLP